MKHDAKIVALSIEKTARPLITALRNTTISTKEEYEKAGKRMAELKELAEIAKQKELNITRPINEALKATRDHFRPFFKTVTEVEATLKEQMVAFLNKQEERRASLKKQVETGEITRLSTFARKTAELEVSNTHAKVRTLKEVKVTNLNKIPRKYMVPDLSLIEDELKKGVTIPGVTLVTKKSIAI